MTTRSQFHTVELPLPPERTFALLHTPSAIRSFWDAARAIVVPRIGGDWIVAWGDNEDAPAYVTAGTIAVLDAPRRLRLVDFRYLARVEGELPFDSRALSLEFTVEPGATSGSVLTVMQDGFPLDASADAFFAGCEAGWRRTLAGIERLARGECAPRSDEGRAQIPELITERLRLRAFRNADVGCYARFCADPEVMRFLGGRPWSRIESWRHIAMMLGHWQMRGYGSFAVERLSDNALIGRVGCIEPDGWPAFEIGWMIGREHQGQGYATEAARAVKSWVRDVLGRDRVAHLIDDANLASQAVARKLGAEPTGRRAQVLGMDVQVWENR